MPEAILQPQTRLEIASGPFHPQVKLAGWRVYFSSQATKVHPQITQTQEKICEICG